MPKDPSRWTDKYVNRASVAAPEYEEGIKHPRRSPTGEAIKKADQWRAKMQDPKTLENYKAGLAYAGDAAWEKGALEKGVVRYAAGVALGAAKYAEFAGKFASHLAGAETKIAAMPKTNLDQSIAKASAQIKHNALFRMKK